MLLNRGLPTGDHYIRNNIASNCHLGLSAEHTRILGWCAKKFYSEARSTVPEVGNGHVEGHLTNNIVQLKGPEKSSQQDTLSWWRWARPIGFMTMVNNRQAEYQSIVLEAPSSITNEILVFVRPRCYKEI